MDKVVSYDVNSPSYNTKLLIATQGSEFKNAITNNVVDYYKQDSIYIKVVDISELKTIKPDNFNAILVIHTWENWKPPLEVKEFIDATRHLMKKIIVLTTSGQGNYKMDGVDAITGESKMVDVDFTSAEVVEKLNPLLNHKNEKP
jgi:hypothetical protein